MGKVRSSLLVAAGVLAVRGVIYASSDHFHTEHLRPMSMWHLLDPEVLRANPWSALWDVHTTPPLFNFAVGAVLRWSPLPDALSFQLLFTAGGVFSAIAVSELLRSVGCRRWVAGVTAVVVFTEPSLIGFETYLAHESFVIPMLLATIWAVAAYAQRPTLRRYGLVLVAGTVLVLTRAMFHPVWLVAVMAVLGLLRPPPVAWRRRVIVVSALPLVVVAGVMVKNEVRFGSFSLSSWAGMNLSRLALMPLGMEERERLVDDGVLSSMALVEPFRPYDEFSPHVEPCDADFGTPALDDALKSDGFDDFPNVNYNYACFVPVYEQAQRDAMAAIRHRPVTYAESVRANAVMFVSDPRAPVELGGIAGRPARALARVHRVIDLQVTTTARYPNTYPLPVDVQLTFVLGLAVVAVAAVRASARARRGPSTAPDVVVVVVALTVAYVTTTSLLMDAFENGRFRAPLDPLVYGAVFAGALELLMRGLSALSARRRATHLSRSGSSPERWSAWRNARAAGRYPSRLKESGPRQSTVPDSTSTRSSPLDRSSRHE